MCPLPPEHHRRVYCDSFDNGYIFSGGMAAGSTCVKIAVEAGWDRPGDRGGENPGAVN